MKKVSLFIFLVGFLWGLFMGAEEAQATHWNRNKLNSDGTISSVPSSDPAGGKL